MSRICWYSFALLFAGAGLAAHAHHSIASVYDGSSSVSLEAEVADFRFVNPHPILIVEVQDNGAADAWTLEMDNRFELSRIGISSETFQPGDLVIVTGSPSRVEPRRLYLRRLDRPADGFRYEQVGSRPRIDTGH